MIDVCIFCSVVAPTRLVGICCNAIPTPQISRKSPTQLSTGIVQPTSIMKWHRTFVAIRLQLATSTRENSALAIDHREQSRV